MPITNGQKLFFIVICAAALLVAVLGLFAPQSLAAIFTWLTLPPLRLPRAPRCRPGGRYRPVAPARG